MAQTDADTTRRRLAEAATMTAGEPETWLDTDESRSVGQESDGSGVSTGHASGRRIVELLRTRKDDLTDDDLDHVRKVHGCVRRHLAREPAIEAVGTSTWRCSSTNRGHDPLKKA